MNRTTTMTFLIAALFAFPAHSALVTVDFEGVLTLNSAGTGPAVGGDVSGTFEYVTHGLVDSDALPDRASYDGALQSFSLIVDGLVYNDVGTGMETVVGDDRFGVVDRVIFQADMSGPDFGGESPVDVQFMLESTDLSTLSSTDLLDDLTTVFSPVNGVPGQNWLRMSPAGVAVLRWDITAIRSRAVDVPAPAGFFMLAFGLAVLFRPRVASH